MEYILAVSSLVKTNPSLFWGLTILQFISVAFMVVLTNKLYLKRGLGQKYKGEAISERIKSRALNEMLHETKSDSSKISQVAYVGLKSYASGGSSEDIQESMDAILLEEQAEVEKNLAVFAKIAHFATLAGLLATIYSFVSVFQKMNSLMTDDQKSKVFSDAVYLATVSTIHGIMIAIPALIMYSVFSNRATRLTDDLNRGALRIFIALGNDYSPKPAKSLSLVK